MHCVQCHGHQPRLGAPVPLIDAASFHADRSGQTVAALAAIRVQNKDRPMPPSMFLDASVTAPLVQWANAGAMPVANGCGVHDPNNMPVAGSNGSAGSGVTVPAAGSGAVVPQQGSDWLMFGGDLSDTRDTPADSNETSITAANVANLTELWTWKGASNTATPAVAGGVVYFGSWDGKVHALDQATGKELWMTALPHLIDSSPALNTTQVFVSDDHGSLHALDRKTGMKQWSTVVDMHPEAHLWSSPIYVQDANMIVIGVAAGEEQVQPPYSFKGSVVGFDATTGMEKWRFYTTTGDTASGPGVGVWATAVIDTTRKLAFIGTGNAYSGTAGQYTDSMLALNYENGMLAWSHQFTKGDVFSIYGGSAGPDFDIGAAANLFTLNGKDVIGISIKSGDYTVLERETGTQVWTQHISSGSSMGGMIASSAVAEDMVFVASNAFPGESSTIAGLNLKDGMIAWKQTISGGLVYGGVLHSNGVVYVGSSSSQLIAYEAKTGKQLWMQMAPDAIAGGPCIAHGMLFVPWGYTWTLREGMAGTGGLTAYGLK